LAFVGDAKVINADVMNVEIGRGGKVWFHTKAQRKNKT